MLQYALCLLYHSNTEAVLFAYLPSDWATTTGRQLGPNVGNSIKCFSKGHSDTLPHRKSSQGFSTFRLLSLPTEPRRRYTFLLICSLITTVLVRRPPLVLFPAAPIPVVLPSATTPHVNIIFIGYYTICLQYILSGKNQLFFTLDPKNPHNKFKKRWSQPLNCVRCESLTSFVVRAKKINHDYVQILPVI